MFSANSSQVSDDKLFVEDVFQSWLYTGNGSTQTITNGIDLAGKGGLVWIKDRNNTGDPKNHYLYDTVRGTSVSLSSNTTSGNLSTSGIQLTAFNNNGFSLGSSSNVNQNTFAHVSWSFREAPKFFDVVTWTGNGVSGRAISHSLGVAPGCIIVKRLNNAAPWQVYHRSLPTNGANGVYNLYLNTTDAQADNGSFTTAASATEFYVGQYGATNGSGDTYVAYLFAHDTTSDGIIQCGSYSGVTEVNLGWEPQWLLIKPASNTAGWYMFDNMRGLPTGGTGDNYLEAQSSAAENTTYPFNLIDLTSTGFKDVGLGYTNTVYIAIRRGPMRTPTSGTSVFSPVARTGTGAVASITSPGFAPDLTIIRERNTAGTEPGFYDKLRGVTKVLRSNLTNAEYTNSSTQEVTAFTNLGFNLAASSQYVSTNDSGYSYINYVLKRAPSFFDVVCYTGTGSLQNVNHNLGVAPELIIVKRRNTSGDGNVYAAPTGPLAIGSLFSNPAGGFPGSIAFITGDDGSWGGVTPTSTVFTVNRYTNVNASGSTYIAYLFASCPGVSKVGSYTGNGSSQTINCGFAAGARFVMIKRTDSAGDWYVWDSARGIVSGNDPHLSLNTTAAEVTTDDSVDTDSSGFVVNQLSATNINVSSAQYIYLAVA